MVQDLELLTQIYNAFNPFQPLPAGDPVYIDCREMRGSGDIIRGLGREILWYNQNTYQLYASYRGAGKSTELLRLKKYLEDNHCFVVYFAADEEDIDRQDAQYTDILLACTRHLLEELKNTDPKPLLNWLQQRWQKFKDLALTEISLEGLSVEAQIWELVQLTANLRGTPSLRKKIREQIKPHTTTLIEALNQFIAEATKQLPAGYNELVVIADNLDRIVPVIQEDGKTNHEDIFLEHSKQLKALDCHLIYTVPISLLYSNLATDLLDIYGEVHILTMIMVRTPDEQVYEPGLNKLKEVIAKRVSQVAPSLSLETDIFDGQQTLEKLCLMSGGHVRQLLFMMQSAIALTDSLPISAKALQQAIAQSKNTYRNSLDEDQWSELAEVCHSKIISNNPLCHSLLFNQCILEYRYSDDQGNVQRWYDVHPLLKGTREFQQAWHQVDKETASSTTVILKEHHYKYQIGGALRYDSPTYITRQADEELYTGLKDGEFCYIFSARQTGKSSLRLRTQQRLGKEGFFCILVDLSVINSKDITSKEWYYALVHEITKQLSRSTQLLESFNLREWVEEQDELLPVQVFSQFIDDVLLATVSQTIVIFLDEIDCIYSLNFPVDNFFAFIRNCYEMRSSKPEYQRLNFVLLGVVNPSDLIQNTIVSPLFNIGRAIQIEGFELYEAQPLAEGLTEKVDNPQEVLKQILAWTGGQPFLTQKLCQCVVNSDNFITTGSEAESTEQLVRQQIIEKWEEQDEPLHLQTIYYRLLASQNAIPLLKLYQQIIQQGEVIADASPEQKELRLSGIVVRQDGKLRVKSRIYQEIFNQSWLDECWNTLQPVINQQKNTYRLLINSLQNQIFVGQRSHLQIELQPTTPGQDTIELPNDIAELYCFISTNGLQVIGSEVITMPLDPKTGHPLPVSFEVQAYLRGARNYRIELFVEDPDTGRTSIFQSSDRVIVKPPEALKPQPPPLPTLDIPIAPPFVLQVETDLPDVPDGDDGSHHLRYYLTTRLTNLQLRHQPVGNVVLTAADLATMRSLLTQTLQQANHFSPEDARERLISLGSYFFDLFFPADTAAAFREAFWQICDQISTWLIIEDGITWLPWELVVPYQEDHTTPWRFWGEQYRLSRWIQGLGIPFYNEVPFSEVAFTHYQALDSEQQDQWERLLQAYSCSEIQQVVNPETPFYALHLVRHRDELNQRDIVVRGKGDAETRGDSGENSFVGNGEEEIPKARLNLRLKRPIVTLSILNGALPHIYSNDWLLPERVLPFLKAGASAVVGTWWQTTEAAERVFWSRFYDFLDNRLPLGEVVWRSRLAVQRALPHSPDWLAYTLLGNPRAKPYEPEDSMGYTALECLSADEPLQPGKTYYFRASIRTRPPVWYKDRLIQPEALTNDLTALFLAPGLEITESEPIPMQPAGRTMRQATVPLTASAPGNYVLRVQLFEDEEYLKTLSMTLKVADLFGEEMVNG